MQALIDNYYCVTSLDEALSLLAERGGRARLIAGATDLILEIERGIRQGIDTLIDISRVPGLDRITLDEKGMIHLGPLVTHNHCVASDLIKERAFPLARAAWEVGAPQIRNRGTVAGNLITASPANDTIPPLMALGTRLTLKSKSGTRIVPLEEFYTGVRRTVMNPDEALVDISFPALADNQRGAFYKLGLRRAQAISLVNAAVILSFQGDRVEKACLTLGSVAPVIVHARETEEYLSGRRLDQETIETAALLARSAVRPIDDLRGSAAYRLEMVRVTVMRCLRALSTGQERVNFPSQPPLLWGKGYSGEAPVLVEKSLHTSSEAGMPIQTRINGLPYTLHGASHKTLLRLLREDAGLIGTKEGCAEGECGACTVFLDGMAVMSCMVLAPRAHRAEIVTIEGLARDGELHPVQQAFIDAGAVQCGYCTPGFIMSGAMLLEEYPHPTQDQVKQAITGNLCRCTGYFSIVSAIERAAMSAASSG